MNIIVDVIQGIMDAGASVFLPLFITILGIVFGIKPFDSLRNGLRIGAGFLGIQLVLSLLMGGLQPVVDYYSSFEGTGFTVVYVGWQGIGSIAWSTSHAILFVPIALVWNYILIRLRFTKTMDVDIWDYFHFFLGSAVLYYVLLLAGMSETMAYVIGLLVGLLTFTICLKLADKTAKRWQEHYNLPGTSCMNFDTYYMWLISWAVCKIVEKIPGLNKINININYLNEKFGALGETSVTTFVIGILLSVLTKQSIVSALTISVTLSATIIIMPKMVALLMEGLVPVSNAARKFFQKRLGDEYEINIGMDQSISLGDPVGIECSAIMIPICILISFLPGVKMFPLAALGALIYYTCAASMYSKGDIFKTVLCSAFICYYVFLMDSWLAPLVTQVGVNVGFIHDASTLISGAEIEEFDTVLIGILGKFLKVW